MNTPHCSLVEVPADPKALKEYARLRKVGYDAKQALHSAKHFAQGTKLDWDTFREQHVAVATGKVDGFDVRVEVDYGEGETYDISFTDENTGIRNPKARFNWGHSPRDKYVVLESGTTWDLAKEFNRRGMSKHVAWETARESLEKEAREYINNNVMTLVAHAVVSVAGVEVGEGGYIGTELSDNEPHLEYELDMFVSETDIIEQAIEDARNNLPAIVEAQRLIVAKIEGLTNV